VWGGGHTLVVGRADISPPGSLAFADGHSTDEQRPSCDAGLDGADAGGGNPSEGAECQQRRRVPSSAVDRPSRASSGEPRSTSPVSTGAERPATPATAPMADLGDGWQGTLFQHLGSQAHVGSGSWGTGRNIAMVIDAVGRAGPGAGTSDDLRRVPRAVDRSAKVGFPIERTAEAWPDSSDGESFNEDGG